MRVKEKEEEMAEEVGRGWRRRNTGTKMWRSAIDRKRREEEEEEENGRDEGESG